MIKIANFCGGRGSDSIIRELLKYPHIRLTNIVNAYDDGKSSGYVRRFFRMLGPSDIRKTQLVMMNDSNSQDAALEKFFKFRFPSDIEHAFAVNVLQTVLDGKSDHYRLRSLLIELDTRRRNRILF